LTIHPEDESPVKSVTIRRIPRYLLWDFYSPHTCPNKFHNVLSWHYVTIIWTLV